MTFLHYLVQVNLYLVLFYGFYRLLLSNETFYNLNRIYLVGSAVLSFGIPFWYSDYIQSFFITQQVNEVFYTVLSPAVFGAKASAENPFTWYDLLKVFYGFCTIFLSIKLIFNFLQLKRILGNSESHTKFGAGFSFFNFVFVDKDLQKHEVVMEHEYVHIKQLHSADVILFEVIAVLCWFNPVVYFYKKSVKHIHEFIADDIASKLEASKADYAMLLFSQQFGLNPHQLTNQFIDKSTLKRRIEMLHKPRSRKIALLKYGFTAPLFALMLVIASASIAKNKDIKKVEKIVASTAEMPITELSILPIKEILAEKETPVRGKVTAAEDGKPLAGVMIMVKDKNRGTTTDVDGNYTINATPADELIFTFVGFESSTVPVTDKKVIDVKLKSKNDGTPIGLHEVVVAGYKPTINYESEEIFTTVEENPSFPDGLKAMYQFIARNLRYPEPARRFHVQGKVFVKFVVRKDGSVSDLQILKGIGFGCDEETVRVLGSMPKWNPGKQNGKPVSVYFTMPVSFVLEEDKTALTKADFPWEKLIVIENGISKTYTGKDEIRQENERLKKTIGEIEKHEVSVNTIEKSMTIRILDKLKTSEKGVDIFSQPRVNFVNGEPLFVIDGKVVAKEEMSSMKPEDIVTIDVLRDASAAAIYGEKGKNGVVLIKTKKNIKIEFEAGKEKSMSDEVYTTVSEAPNFPGGVKEMYQFIGKNLRYPKEAQRNNIKGKVFIKFVVRKDGSISDMSILQGIGHGCEEEAMRIIGMMPKWNPGKQNGVPVNTYFTMPIAFVLE